MKILLCISSLKDIESTLTHFNAQPEQKQTLKFIHFAKILHHEVDIVETGAGIFQTTYKMAKALSIQKYHLALKVSLACTYNENIPVSSVLNIVNEKPGDCGMMVNGEWKDWYDLDLINRMDDPHQRGGFINLNNAYMNVFAPFKKVVGVTVNHYADRESFLMKKEKYKADCETLDSLGFVYPCLFEKQNFFQLGVIERNLATGEENLQLAQKTLNNTLMDLLAKL
ncbi:MAG: hypothetical protein IPP77_00930 [Bacteroidetes bacterium]|nr:hypothetical protein [Bacteroidota bacterium]